MLLFTFCVLRFWKKLPCRISVSLAEAEDWSHLSYTQKFVKMRLVVYIRIVLSPFCMTCCRLLTQNAKHLIFMSHCATLWESNLSCIKCRGALINNWHVFISAFFLDGFISRSNWHICSQTHREHFNQNIILFHCTVLPTALPLYSPKICVITYRYVMNV
jgi:hypothetical protein